MEAILTGKVVKSIKETDQNGKEKEFASTAIYTSMQEMMPTKVSTRKVMKEGEIVTMRVKVGTYLVEGKSFLIVKETDDQKGLPVIGK
jgi:hypothetical protein